MRARTALRCGSRQAGTCWEVVAGVVVLACGGSTTPPEAAQGGPPRTALIAQPCPGLELGSEPLDLANARVFIEVAEVNTRALPNPIGRWLNENAVTVRSTANLVAFPNVPTSMPWGQCVDAVCSDMKRSITLTAHLPERASEPLELALRIDEAAKEGSDTGPKALLETTLRAQNQEPVVLPGTSGIGDGSVIVTAYLLQRHDDLHRVLECKVRQRDREMALP